MMSETVLRKENSLFSCEFCDETYTSENDLRMHSSLHRGSNEFVCMVCQESFSKLTDLKAHDLIHSLNEANVKLDVESEFDYFKESVISHNETFSNDSELQIRQNIHVLVPKEESINNEIKIVEVKTMVTMDTWFMLPVSKEVPNYEFMKMITSKNDCTDTDQKTTIPKKFECDTCGKKFGRQMNLRMHMRTHSRPHVCRVCDKRFAELKKLRKHVLSHEKAGNVRFQCELCKEVFYNEAALLKHCSSFHDKTKRHVCDVCNRRFSNKSDLTRHKLSHQRKQFVCGLCNARFTLLLYLKRHMIVHLPNKPFCCTICGKKYSRKRFLLSHLSTHDITENSRQPVIHYMSDTKEKNIQNEVNIKRSKLCELLNKIDV